MRTEGIVLRVSMSNRSSVDSALRALQSRMAAFAEVAGGEATQSECYPGWKPDMASPVLGRMKAIHERVVGKPALRDFLHDMFERIPDVRWDETRHFACPELAVVEWLTTGRRP